MKRRQSKVSATVQPLDDAKLERVGGGYGFGDSFGFGDFYDSDSDSGRMGHEIAHPPQSGYRDSFDPWSNW